MSGACIELHVHSYAGTEVSLPALRLGGAPQSIGRSPGCHLSLDDPERLVSRSHLQVWIEAGRGAVVRNSSAASPAFVDGEELPPGQTVQVRCGQRLMLGRYLLAIREGIAADALVNAVPAPAAAPALAQPAAEPALPSVIPEAFDVFAMPAAEAREPSGAAPELALILGTSSVAEDLFENIQPFDARGPRNGLEQSDPLALPRQRAAGSEILDLVAAPDATPTAISDGGAGELDAMFALPRGAAANTGLLAGLGAATDVEPGLDLAEIAAATGPATGTGADPIGVPEPTAAHASEPPSAPASTPGPGPAPRPGHGRVDERSGAAHPRPAEAGELALSKAFARGCGLPEDRLDGLDEAAMEALGRTFAALVSGALQLIHARSSTKHELRANVTIIASSGNNPLKFAPDTQAALMQLLGRGLPGFMGPEAAVADAFDDLRAHQVGLLSASRTALYAMGQRLSPEVIQAVAGGPRGFSGLLPSAHKARLWDHFVSSHGALLGEAREEFDAVFQQAFVQAYEGEVERLQGGGRG